jgi:type IVB pilus formation R64 PilN family outer membrane protein
MRFLSNAYHRNSARRLVACGAGLSALVLLGGCQSPILKSAAQSQLEGVHAQIAKVAPSSATSVAPQSGAEVRGGVVQANRLAHAQLSMPVARRAQTAWVGSEVVPATTEDRLPAIFFEPFVLDFSDMASGGVVSIQTAMARVSRLAGVPVRIQPDVFLQPVRGGNSGGSPPPISNNVQRLPLAAGTPTAGPGAGVPVLPLNALSRPGGVGGTQAGGAQGQQFAAGAAALGLPVQGPNAAMPGGRAGAVVPGGPASVRASDDPSAARNPDSVTQYLPTSVDNVAMRFRGHLAGYLNQVCDALGLAWEYRDGTVVIMRFIVELHEVFSFPGEVRYSMSSSGTGQGQGGGGGGAFNAASASLEVVEKGESNPFDSIERAVKDMLQDAPGSSVTRTDGSGRLLVKAPREFQARVRDYIRQENAAMRRQANIQFDIYSVTVSNEDERGVNWSVILQKAGESLKNGYVAPASLASVPAGTATMSVISQVPGNQLSELLGNSALMLQALNQQGFAAQHRPVSLLALNRQWGRISRMSTEYYLSETTPGPASSTGVGAPGLKTDKVTTGDQYVAIPQILDDNTVLLKFGLSLSDLLGIFDVSVGSGAQAQKIQAPKVNAVNAQFPVAIRPGEVVAVTGLTRVVSNSDSRRLAEGASMALGGSTKMALKREHFIIFIRPTLL